MADLDEEIKLLLIIATTCAAWGPDKSYLNTPTRNYCTWCHSLEFLGNETQQPVEVFFPDSTQPGF